MSEHDPELRPAYQTLDEPARLLGLSVAGWATLLTAGAVGYGWLLISPLPWRMNFTLAVLVLGAPAALVLMREQSTISPARLLAAVLRWRARAPLLIAPTEERPVVRGAIRLDAQPTRPDVSELENEELPWISGGAGERQ